MKKEYAVVFDWKGEGLLKELFENSESKAAFERTYYLLYNRYSAEADKHVDDWNELAKALGIEAEQGWDNPYVVFMRMKHEELLKKIEETDDLFKQVLKMNDWMTTYAFHLGDELEFHMTLTMSGLSENWVDVTFHVEERELA